MKRIINKGRSMVTPRAHCGQAGCHMLIGEAHDMLGLQHAHACDHSNLIRRRRHDLIRDTLAEAWRHKVGKAATVRCEQLIAPGSEERSDIQISWGPGRRHDLDIAIVTVPKPEHRRREWPDVVWLRIARARLTGTSPGLRRALDIRATLRTAKKQAAKEPHKPPPTIEAPEGEGVELPLEEAIKAWNEELQDQGRQFMETVVAVADARDTWHDLGHALQRAIDTITEQIRDPSDLDKNLARALEEPERAIPRFVQQLQNVAFAGKIKNMNSNKRRKGVIPVVMSARGVVQFDKEERKKAWPDSTCTVDISCELLKGTRILEARYMEPPNAA